MGINGQHKAENIITHEKVTQKEVIYHHDINNATFADGKIAIDNNIYIAEEKEFSFNFDVSDNYSINKYNTSSIKKHQKQSYIRKPNKISEIEKKKTNLIPIVGNELTYQNDVGDDYLPTLIEFEGKLFAIWYTDDPQISDGDDIDIVYRTYDGHIWSDIKEISNNNENDNFPSRCGEKSGKAIVYSGNLYFIWHVYGEGKILPYKIMIKSFDGVNWNKTKEISLSDKYWFYRAPAAEVYKDKLYITWDAGDIDPFDHTDMLMCYFDGKDWSEPIDIIPTYDGSKGPAQMKVFRERLYITWLHDGNLPYDQCIKMKYWDGTNWGHEIIVDPNGDARILSDVEIYNNELYITWAAITEDLHRWYKIIGFDGNNFSEIYTIEFQEDNILASYDNKLFSIGTTWDPKYTSGTDRDIVMESYNGSSWDNMIEISYKHDESSNSEGYDNDPFIYVFNNRLYAIWQTISSITSTGDDLDIIIKDVSSSNP
jgi:hypothetical protein